MHASKPNTVASTATLEMKDFVFRNVHEKLVAKKVSVIRRVGVRKGGVCAANFADGDMFPSNDYAVG